MKHEKKAIRRLAYRARNAVETLAKFEDQRGIIGMNCQYSLAGYCARASTVLSELMNLYGFKNVICYGEEHVYVEWKNHIIDITATQFSNKFGKTMVRTPKSLKAFCKQTNNVSEQNWNWENRISFYCAQSFINWQIEEEWPEEQTANLKDLLFLREFRNEL
jgi:hypothetical protein